MDLFKLPSTTIVNKVIPKNAFGSFTNTKQKKLFIDKITRITWLNKISKDTINIPSNEIEEIQIFLIELKAKEEIPTILQIIDKAIPYHIIFAIKFQDDIQFSTSAKHIHPTNDNISIIDWTFNSPWGNADNQPYNLILKTNIDTIFNDFCFQLSGQQKLTEQSITSLIQYQKQIKDLQKTITKLKTQIKKSKQFNKKVELNIELKKIEEELLSFSSLNKHITKYS